MARFCHEMFNIDQNTLNIKENYQVVFNMLPKRDFGWWRKRLDIGFGISIELMILPDVAKVSEYHNEYI